MRLKKQRFAGYGENIDWMTQPLPSEYPPPEFSFILMKKRGNTLVLYRISDGAGEEAGSRKYFDLRRLPAKWNGITYNELCELRGFYIFVGFAR